MREDLQRHVPSQAHIGGAVDVAHAATGEQPDDAIRSDARIDAEQRVVLRERASREHERRGFEKTWQRLAGRREGVRLCGELRVFDAKLGPQPLARARIGGKPRVVPVGEQQPAIGAHGALPWVDTSSCCSQARAVFQSLITVRTDTPSASAVSSTVNPPKKRNSTT